MLQLQLIGRIGKDAELVGKNKDITTFSVAVGKGEETQWFRCTLFQTLSICYLGCRWTGRKSASTSCQKQFNARN